MMQTDVKSGAAAANATTTIFAGPARIKAISISYSTGATVVLNDGTGGTARFSLLHRLKQVLFTCCFPVKALGVTPISLL